MKHSQLRKQLNYLLAKIKRARMIAATTTSSQYWSRTMHRLKALRAKLRALCIELKELLFCERRIFMIHGKGQECAIINSERFGCLDVRSLVTGEYFRVFNYSLTNSYDALSLGYKY